MIRASATVTCPGTTWPTAALSFSTFSAPCPSGRSPSIVHNIYKLCYSSWPGWGNFLIESQIKKSELLESVSKQNVSPCNKISAKVKSEEIAKDSKEVVHDVQKMSPEGVKS